MVKSSALKILTTKIGYYLPFAYELLQSTKIEVLGHARHYISVVQPTLACIPSYTEQTKIGECIQQLDNLITLHQRKQNDKFSLFKPKNYANFLANSWEQRKLGEVANIQKGQQLGKAEMSNNGAFYVLNGGMEPSGYTRKE